MKPKMTVKSGTIMFRLHDAECRADNCQFFDAQGVVFIGDGNVISGSNNVVFGSGNCLQGSNNIVYTSSSACVYK